MATKSKSDKIKLIVYISLAIITFIGAVLGVNRYFAKSEDTEKTVTELIKQDALVSERLDIAITDDQIFQQQQHIQQMKNYHVFEHKAQTPELTPMEQEALDGAERRLEELKKEKERKIQIYEGMRKK